MASGYTPKNFEKLFKDAKFSSENELEEVDVLEGGREKRSARGGGRATVSRGRDFQANFGIRDDSLNHRRRRNDDFEKLFKEEKSSPGNKPYVGDTLEGRRGGRGNRGGRGDRGGRWATGGRGGDYHGNPGLRDPYANQQNQQDDAQRQDGWGFGRGRGGNNYRGGRRFTHSSNEFSSRANYERTASVNDMRRLEELPNSEGLLALLDPSTGLLKLFESQQMSDEAVELLLRITLRACSAADAQQSIQRLLKSICESGYLEKSLSGYIMRGVMWKNLEAEVANNAIELCSKLMGVLPTFSFQKATLILASISQWAESVRDDRSFARTIETLKAAQELEKDIIKQRRSGEVMKDQEEEEDNADDTPPDDYRKIQTMPTVAEIRSDIPPYLRKNLIYGPYKTANHYLDVQYRLLREDFVCPLREGIRTLLRYQEENIPLRKIPDIRIYSKVQILMPYCTQKGIMYRTKFDVSYMKNVRWEGSKRLIFGSLVGLSKDRFENIIFGTVADRQPAELSKGIVDLFFEDRSSSALDPNPYTEYQMVECSAYFEAYRHVLEGLQEMQENDLPFRKYILNQCESKSQVDPPFYLRGRNIFYDLSICIRDKSPVTEPEDLIAKLSRLNSRTAALEKFQWRSVPILDRGTWPTAEDFELDQSQYDALQTALTKEFAVIQGPPGTGKTFIGLKIAQILLHNYHKWSAGRRNPILVVCYTNHALDQFLEGIIQLCSLEPGELIRIGGQSSSTNPQLLACSTHDLRKNKHLGTGSRHLIKIMQEEKRKMSSIEAQITNISAEMNCARTQVIHEQFLQRYMMPVQAQSLCNGPIPWNQSALHNWLELYNKNSWHPDISDQAVAESERNDELDQADAEEITRIEQERKIDETVVIAQRKEHLDHIQQMSEDLSLKMAVNNYDEDQCDEEEFVEKKSKKKKRRMVRANIGFENLMPQEEVSRVANVWRLSLKDRWRLYNYWLSLFCQERAAHIGMLNEQFNQSAGYLAELNREQDYVMLQGARVIGMTTTGAAKYRRMVQRVEPRVVIVEEAAEVMESHIIATLSYRCEHLIMIGDHQQLRPNPTVYKLAKEYNLNISLFERMVKNKIHCDKLLIQHRMRPEVAELIVPHIYKELENHESVERYPNIRGVSGNVFFITHSSDEQNVDDSRSRSNIHEAQYITALTKYLLLQGYKPSQITVLTTYTGQMFLLKKNMPKSYFEGVRITPVDNYQGEENDIILLSLVRSNEEGKIGFLSTSNRVCVALSRAKWGLYVIGNMELLAEASSMWNSIIKDLKKRSRLVEALPLACQNHPGTVILARSFEDFSRAPEGGCMLDCGWRLECGHACEKKCHPVDRDHQKILCSKPCAKILCPNEHCCPRLCYEICTDCMVLVKKTIPKCGHKQMVPCSMPAEVYECREACQKLLPCGHACREFCGASKCTEECSVIVKDRLWIPCYHELSVACHLNSDNFPCNVKLARNLICGHTADMLCSDSVDGYQCMVEVKVSLCGNDSHVSTILCHEESNFKEKPCKFMVRKTCNANKEHAFSVACSARSTALCPQRCNSILACGHKCSGKCGSCSSEHLHPPCQLACERILPCEHKCKGKCGSACPPCGERCQLFCGHQQCDRACHMTCRSCELPCKWSCAHEKCDLLCKEPCTRRPCNMPCNLVVLCPKKHPCAGLCGELCPPLCRFCQKPILEQILQNLEAPALDKNTRFVFLQPCGHTVDVKSMDEWVEASEPAPPCEIVPLKCPVCMKMVGICPRYNARIKAYMKQITIVKESTDSQNRFTSIASLAMNSMWSYPLPAFISELVKPEPPESGPDRMWKMLSIGSLCVYQECCNVSDICKRKRADVSAAVESLKENKEKLVKSIEERNNTDIAEVILKLYQLYLCFHVHRLLGFIKNHYKIDELTDLHIALDPSKHVAQSRLRDYSSSLQSSFTMQQKESIENFLDYLDEYFDAEIKIVNTTSIGMLCTKGHAYVCSEDEQKTLSAVELDKLCLQCNPGKKAELMMPKSGKCFKDILNEQMGVDPAGKSTSGNLRIRRATYYQMLKDGFDVGLDSVILIDSDEE